MENRLNKLVLISMSIIMLMPLVFYLLDDKIYSSLSAMVDSPNNSIFYLFIYFAAYTILTYSLKDDNLILFNKSIKNKGFETVPALALIGVGLFHYKHFVVIHYIFAAIFFISSIANIVIFSAPKERFIKVLISLITCFFMTLYFLNYVTLLLPEIVAILTYIINIYLEIKKQTT